MAKSSLLVLALLSLLTTGVRAWDPFGLLGSARKAIEEAGEHLVGNAKEAFEESMQKLFDDDITPLVNKVNAMAMEDIGVLKNDVEEIVNDATEQIKELIDHAASVAQHLIDKTIDEIKEKIIDETAQKIMDVEDHFFQGLNSFLQKFYETVKKINCMAQGDINLIYEEIYKLLGKGCTFFPDKCCREGGVAGKRLTDMGDTQLYGLHVCRRTSDLDAKTPVQKLEDAYVDCQILAKKFYCTNFGAATAKDLFTKEYNKWGVKYDFWAHPNKGHDDAVMHEPTWAGNSSCNTPLECYKEAISKLEEARAEIKDKADMAVVQPLIDAQAKEEAVQAEELKVFHGDSCPDGWVEAEVTKGYLLVGRPQDGSTGNQINSPLSNGEASRVGPHGHQASVVDNGHGHGVTDPGHSHSFQVHDNRAGYVGGGVWTDLDQYGHTSRETTGITIDSATTGVQVSVQDTQSEGYPLAYVLLCQRAPTSRAGGVQSFIV